MGALYAGPICASNGQKINIGVFSDENCYNYDNSKDVEDYLVDGDGYSMRLSHALLKNTYDAEQCVSCLVVEEAGKCEQAHGFEGISYCNDAMYENQVATEDVVCNYIKSINNGQYTEDGEIKVKGGNASSGSDASTTGGQKFALTFFIIGTVGLAIYAATLHAKLTKGSSASLSENSAGVSA